MTTVSEIAAELSIDPKRARRILRKSDIAHEHGAAWDLDAKQAARVRKLLIEKTSSSESVAAKPAKKVEAKKPAKTAAVAKPAKEPKTRKPKTDSAPKVEPETVAA